MTIIHVLQQNGFNAYAVGGCIRDILLLKEPDDWDICTSALPKQIKKCFADDCIIKTGIKHGTVTVLKDHIPYEVTTFRTDGEYSDFRHPDSVKFVTSLQEDLSRRDFTINAMAFNPKQGLIDCFGGKDDLTQGIIRCVGNPNNRFQEDALRILRALRFAAALGFHLDTKTANAIHEKKDLLKNISSERIRIEFCKLLCGKDALRMLMQYTDVFSIFIPEIKPMIGFPQNHPMHFLDVWQHTLQSIQAVPPQLPLRLTMLFHDIAKPLCHIEGKDGKDHFYNHPQKSAEIAEIIMKRLKFDSKTLNTVKTLVLYHDSALTTQSRNIKKWLNQLGEDRLQQLIEVKRADITAQSPAYRIYRLDRLNEITSIMQTILQEHQCFCVKQLAVDGRDLMEIGIPEGKQIGKILDCLVKLVIENKIENKKDALLSFAEEKFG